MEVSVNLAVEFLREEEEELVFLNWPADGEAEVVPAQFAFRYRGRGIRIEPVVSIQRIVSSEVIDGSVEAVGATASDYVDLASSGLPILGPVGVSDNLTFRDGINRMGGKNRALRTHIVVGG